MKPRTKKPKETRRTTVTLRAAALNEAEEIARSRNVTVSSVINEGLDQYLRNRANAEQRWQAWRAYSESLRGFTEAELMTLDGIIMQPRRRRKR
jgi:hypothetical protein